MTSSEGRGPVKLKVKLGAGNVATTLLDASREHRERRKAYTDQEALAYLKLRGMLHETVRERLARDPAFEQVQSDMDLFKLLDMLETINEQIHRPVPWYTSQLYTQLAILRQGTNESTHDFLGRWNKAYGKLKEHDPQRKGTGLIAKTFEKEACMTLLASLNPSINAEILHRVRVANIQRASGEPLPETYTQLYLLQSHIMMFARIAERTAEMANLAVGVGLGAHETRGSVTKSLYGRGKGNASGDRGNQGAQSNKAETRSVCALCASIPKWKRLARTHATRNCRYLQQIKEQCEQEDNDRQPKRQNMAKTDKLY